MIDNTLAYMIDETLRCRRNSSVLAGWKCL